MSSPSASMGPFVRLLDLQIRSLERVNDPFLFRFLLRERHGNRLDDLAAQVGLVSAMTERRESPRIWIERSSTGIRSRWLRSGRTPHTPGW